MTEPGFSGTQAAKVVGITYRQLDYWARTDLIRPSLTDAAGSGSRRRYSYNDLLELRVIKTLLDAGIKLESVRDVFEYLRKHVGGDIASAHLVISGNSVVLAEGDELIDVLRQGQGVLNVLSLAGVKDDIDTQLVPLEASIATAPRRRRRWSDERAPRAIAARRDPPPSRRQDGALRRVGDATRVPRDDRRTPRLPERRRDVRRVTPRHRARRGCRCLRRAPARLTNDLSKIQPGRAQYTHLLDDADASVLDDIIVWWHPSSGGEAVFDVMPNASNTDRVRAVIGGRETTHDRAVIAVQGPTARTTVASFWPEAAEVGRFRVAHCTWRETPCVVAGTGYTGEDGIEIAVPADVAGSLWDALVAAGTVPAGLGARDTLRLEAALPLHGHELGPGITSLQAGLGWVVAWDKGEFPGPRRARRGT